MGSCPTPTGASRRGDCRHPPAPRRGLRADHRPHPVRMVVRGLGMNHAGELQTARSSARLGLTLRLVLLAPGQGFESALMGAERRDRAAQRPAEGYAPYLLAAVGGAALFLMWLKIGALSGLRDEASYRLVYLVMALGLGAILGLVAQALWGLTGGRLFESHRATPRNLRLVWGLAAFPNVVTLSVLLPLDLVVVGPAGYTAARLADPVATA